MLLLQPLLENAFKHGVERSVGLVIIQIDARRESDLLVLEIRNIGLDACRLTIARASGCEIVASV